MAHFLKLTKFIINKNSIQSIIVEPNKYRINVISNGFMGANWNIAVFGVGGIASQNTAIEVCQIEHSVDYKIVSDWIHNM